MIYNTETKKALTKISGFVSPDGDVYDVTGSCGKSVFKAMVHCKENNKSNFVRWEKGIGWREAGTGNGGSKEQWLIIMKGAK